MLGFETGSSNLLQQHNLCFLCYTFRFTVHVYCMHNELPAYVMDKF